MSTELLFDRIWETTNTAGTGTVTLNGAKIGYKSFSVVGNNNTVTYCITNNINFEVGIGTYITGGPFLTRDVVLSSTNANNLVNFPGGSKEVFLVATAELLTQINIEDNFRTSELISGGKAVRFNTSGNVEIARANVSGRMPAIGVVVDNVASGDFARIYNRARLNSPTFNFSGYIGAKVWVGNSGELIVSGAPSASGNVQQILGVVNSHSGMMIEQSLGLIAGANITLSQLNGATLVTATALALASGSVQSGNIGNNAVTSGNIASGQIGWPHLASGAVRSGHIGNNAVTSGNVASGQIDYPHLANASVKSGTIASGQITWAHLASGAVASGNVAPNAISSGNIAPGQIGWTHLASGAVRSGNIGNGAVTSGNIASGQISTPHFASGATIDSAEWLVEDTFLTAESISGGKAVGFDNSGALQIAMASVSGKMPAIGVVVDNVLSGTPARVYRHGRVYTDNVDFSGCANRLIYVGISGEIGVSGGMVSGEARQVIGVVISDSGMMLGQPLGLTAGKSITFVEGNGATIIQLSSGAIQSGDIGDGAVTSGNIASGQVSNPHFASGSIIDFSRTSITTSFLTAELISGVKAVGFDTSGRLEIAKAGTSGTMPAFGVVIDNVLSGTAATVYRNGRVFSSAVNFSGWPNQLIYVGVSGDLVASGAPNASGDVQQVIGMTISQSGMMLGQPLGLTAGAGVIFTQGNGATIISTSGASAIIASGTIQSGNIGNNAVTSGNIASGQVGTPHLASGSVIEYSRTLITDNFLTAELISGVKAVGFDTSGALQIAKAGTSGMMPAFGVVIDNVASGTTARVYRNGSVFTTSVDFSGYPNQLIFVGTSGDLVVSGAPSASGDVQQVIGMVVSDSGMMLGQPLGLTAGEGVIFTQGNGGTIISTSGASAVIASGTIQSGNIGNNAVTSGNIASGAISWAHLASGAVRSGNIAAGAVSSGNVASGQIGNPHFASGSTIEYSRTSITDNFLTAELISGVKAVGFDTSGALIIAKAGTSGTMPAFGVVINNVASGAAARVYRNGSVLTASVDFSGYGDQLIYVGTSGDLVVSGAPSASGDVQQVIGMVVSDSGMMLGQPLGLTAGNGIILSQGNGAVIITASGGSATISSGTIQSGNIGNNAVTSGNIASGSISWAHLASGAVASGNIAANAVSSGNIASGQISTPHLASGAIINASQWSIDNTFTTAELISGVKAVGFDTSSRLQIAMASVSGRMPAFGVVINNTLSGTPATVYRNGRVFTTSVDFSGYHNQLIYVSNSGELVVSGAPSASGDVQQVIGMVVSDSGIMLGQPLGLTAGNNITLTQGNGATIITAATAGGLTSGSVQSGNIGNNAVTSGNIASGQISWPHLASGAVRSGNIAAGAVSSGNIASGSISWAHLASGAVASGNIAANAVSSGNIASGSISWVHLASGAVASGNIAANAVSSGNIASGNISNNHFASGAQIDSARWLWDETFITEEPVSGLSGGRAVAMSPSGKLRTAMAGISGRMPAIGVVIDNVASGVAANVYRNGKLFSTVLQFSGFTNQPIFVGQSGQISASGAPTNSGALRQTIGVSIQNSGMMIDIGSVFTEAILLSGNIASGQIGWGHLASGSVSDTKFISGSTIYKALVAGGSPMVSGAASVGTNATLIPIITHITGETVSGWRAVTLNQSGRVIIAMASVSGRMPAMGVNMPISGNALSGQSISWMQVGGAQTLSGMVDYSGFINRRVWVGRSGQIVQMSGGVHSGGFLSGDLWQPLGVIANSGGAWINVTPYMSSGEVLIGW